MPTLTALRVILASLLLPPVLGALLTDPSQLRRDLTYDYIIIGAGNAGNVIADGLSAAKPSKRILILEAGVSDQGLLAAQVPFLGLSLTPGTPYDWNYTTTPQEGLNGWSFPLPRGRILGGCTTVNDFVHQFGSSGDYDKLAKDVKDPSWNWKNIRKYIFKHERVVPPADGHKTEGQYTPENHGTTGVLPVSLPGHSQSIDGRVIATTQELGGEFPFNPDQGGGEVLGMGWVQNSIGSGVRSSSSSTYLASALKRRNVDVLVNAQVTKLIKTGSVKGLPSFHKVQFSRGRGVPTTTVNARVEIILSAGVFGTPQILLLSGIGPRRDLQRLGIPTIIHNPSVGRNLSDHVLLPNIFNVNGTDTLDHILRGDSQGALDEWTHSRTGPFANGVIDTLGYFRLPKDSPIFRTVRDPSTGPKGAHYELFPLNFYFNPGGPPLAAEGSFMTLVTALISPTSRGFVKLASADPFVAPIIDPRFLTTQFDVFAIREAVRAAKRFVGASAWKDYVVSPWGGLSATTDADIDAYVRSQSNSVYHALGTAAMTARNAPWGVVDPDLKLKGAEGVRIADASVFPFLPNGHTQGPVYLLGHRAADIILSS